jgi:methionyl-tRNA formyltransferase
VPSLRALLGSEIEVAGVVTVPDRPAGRGMELKPSPVKSAAIEAGLEVVQPAKARDPELRDWLVDRDPDVASVVAYGKILPASLLEIPRLGFVNVHFSILPAYRGAAPVQRAVMDGVEETGVSIMVLTEGMDEGPVLGVETTPVGPDDTAGEVGARLAELGGPLLVRSLAAYARGELTPAEQDHDAATYAPKVTPDDARIDWKKNATAIHDHVRGTNPAPGAWTSLGGERVKVHRTRLLGDDRGLAPGEIDPNGRLVAGTGAGAIELAEVQMAGRVRMSGEELLRGLRVAPGMRFE